MKHPSHALQRLAGALALSLVACGDDAAAPVVPDSSPAVSGATLAWNQTARELVAARAANSTTQVRILTYVSIAQYNAIVAAEAGAGNASPAAAAAGASVVVLKSMFPLDSALLDQKLSVQRARATWPGERNKDFASGETIGRGIGANVLASAVTDKTDLTTRPANPGGPGYWTGVNSLRGFYQARAFALLSPDQFRPAAPPAFGSAAFNSALAEIRAFSDGLTPAQLTIAQDWAARGGAYMNGVAAEMLVKYNRTERDAAHLLTLANMAGFDVANACFDAKFAYYFIRPSQADPLIKLPIGLPNHPSYPSGHSCSTSAYATIIASAFPEETTKLNAMVQEAGLSRMYGGLHYRFDLEAGQELGRKVAGYVLQVLGASRAAITLY